MGERDHSLFSALTRRELLARSAAAGIGAAGFAALSHRTHGVAAVDRQLQQKFVQAQAPHRKSLLPPEGFPSTCNALRQARKKLPGRGLPWSRLSCGGLMSLDPSNREWRSPSRHRTVGNIPCPT